MLNRIWLALITLSLIIGAASGNLSAVAASVIPGLEMAVRIAVGLLGIMVLWSGLMRVAYAAGLIDKLAVALRPLMRRLFPDVPEDDPAMGAMVMNMAANMMCLANAATPFGLNAMKALEKLNPHPGTATNAMCLFLAINTSSIQLIPITAIAYLTAGGANHPTQIILTGLLASIVSTTVAIVSAKLLEKRRKPS